MRLMNDTNTPPEDLALDAGKLAVLVNLVLGGKINRGAYKETVEAVFMRDADPETYIAEKGLMMVTDDDAVLEAVRAALAANPDAVADYGAGKVKAFGFLMGQVMKKLGGAGNPDMAKNALKNILGSL
jgi:aspartyl-tRNA(Asn)/glutamyl-tRNA(Gln) amidotransferase subunit B